MVHLFEPLVQRDVTLRNRIVVSPMCQYSATPDGVVTDWHFVHLGSRAVGGAGLVFVEATSVEPRGRLSLGDTGLWGDEHVAPLARIARFVKEQGAASGMQLAHGGRKAYSSDKGRGPETPVGPSALPFDDGWVVPEEASVADLDALVAAFARAARRSREAGFDLVEIHGAHGYLLHSFLSPLSNHRTDEYGGSLDNRARLLRRVVTAVREEWPARLPLWVRLSCSDWVPGGLTVDECAEALRPVRELVDVVDCSSGGNVPSAPIPVGPDYQVPFAESLKKAGFTTCAVGMLTSPEQCEAILRDGRADLIALARQELRDPYFPLHAAQALGVELPYWPKQYLRGK